MKSLILCVTVTLLCGYMVVAMTMPGHSAETTFDAAPSTSIIACGIAISEELTP